MADSQLFTTLISQLKTGDLVPYLGPGVLEGVKEVNTGEKMPADSDSLILAMNEGRPMAPRLMYEFPRAAMNLEQKRGRRFIEKFLTTTYGERQWHSSPFHQWLATLSLPYIIDINRDTQFQLAYQNTPHNLVVGLARIAGTDYRFKLFSYDGANYQPVTLENIDGSLPTLFKPMGTPLPEPHFIASDADYVDYITELMGGFAIPSFLKEYRQNKQYVFLGMRLQRDTERMVLSDIIYGAHPDTGWVLIKNPTEKERRYCDKKQLTLVEADWQDLMKYADISQAVA